MRLVHLNDLDGDQCLARTLFDYNGRRLLNGGVRITPSISAKLLEMGIDMVYVEDWASDGIEVQDAVDEEVRISARSVVRSQMAQIGRRHDPDISMLSKVADGMLANIFERKVGLVNFHDLRTQDSRLFSHSVNVAVLSIMLATKLGLTRPKVSAIGLGALLHDFGKSAPGLEYPDKPQEEMNEAEREAYRKHPLQGYNLLKERPEITATTKIAVLMHHEHITGTGWPLGISGEKIHYSARIVSICNGFDGTLHDPASERFHRTSDAVELLKEASGILFDRHYVETFLNLVPIFPDGTPVVLSNGCIAIVFRNNPEHLTRPVVRLLYDPRTKTKFQGMQLADLMKELSLRIVREIRLKSDSFDQPVD